MNFIFICECMVQKKNTVLIIDHEIETKKILGVVLPENEFNIESCHTGKEALRMFVTLKPDIVLLDLNLPDMNGNEVISALREWSHVPIIIITTRAANKDVIVALDLGADDYVIKPFHAEILYSRIKSNLRKSAIFETGESELINGLLRMDLSRHEVFLNDKLVALTPKEYNLLRFLMTHCGKMLTHKQILHQVWGTSHADDAQYLRVFIGQIRKKIETDPSNPTYITTESGVGYRMEFIAA